MFKNALILLATVVSIHLSGDQLNSHKQELWDVFSEEVNHWGDGLGYPVDEEIKEIVIALNLSGIKTTASCDGHLDWGLPYPWVSIEIENAALEELQKDYKLISRKVAREESALKTAFPDLSLQQICALPEAEQLLQLYSERCDYNQRMMQHEQHCLEPLNQLLAEFYEGRSVCYDSELVIPPNSLGYLHSIGGDRQTIRSEEEKSIYLNRYREEMNAFAAFLKAKFFSEAAD